MVHSLGFGYQIVMRLLSALLLLMSLLTTHAVALERAAAKSVKMPVDSFAIVADDERERLQPKLSGHSVETPDAATAPSRPCLSNGDCMFLVPGHTFSGMGILAAYGDRFPVHAHPVRGRLIDRPPIG